MQRIIETTGILIFSAIICVISNMAGSDATLYDSVLGSAVLAAIAIIGFAISRVPYLDKVYAVIWISVVAILASCEICPWNEWIVAVTSKIQLLAVATPILAYAGLSVGKDLDLFKRLSWRIIPVALVAIAGTFLFAALIAQFSLHWEGAI